MGTQHCIQLRQGAATELEPCMLDCSASGEHVRLGISISKMSWAEGACRLVLAASYIVRYRTRRQGNSRNARQTQVSTAEEPEL